MIGGGLPPENRSTLNASSCRITTGGSISENKKVFGGADIPGSQGG